MSAPAPAADTRPVLNRRLLASAGFGPPDVSVPTPARLALPEKAVQFGTGAFLRGFVDFFLDEANRQGRFGGRVVMVGSTGSGRDRTLGEQDGLYTLTTVGQADGEPVVRHRIVGSVSRALSAATQWDEVLRCARNPRLEFVFSNTTEVGIRLDEADAADGSGASPPRSFPGKLTRFLAERARRFDHDPDRGMTVVPCELVEDNGDRLRELVQTLARRWRIGGEFAAWLDRAVPFCNTLVDRIVPGAPDPAQRQRWEAALGYHDGLHTVCEPYRLFAIEAGPQVRRRLSFAAADAGIVVTEVAPYRERKVRLLNGTHTLLAPTALLAGLDSVGAAVRDDAVGRWAKRLMFDEIAPTLVAPDAERFAAEVLDRFANPFVHHALFDITLQAATKLRVRVVPSILASTRATGRVPESLAFGFAAYLLFMRGDLQRARREAGLAVPPDDGGARIGRLWARVEPGGGRGLADLARAACADTELWGVDLAGVPGFAPAVGGYLVRATRDGMRAALVAHLDGDRSDRHPWTP